MSVHERELIENGRLIVQYRRVVWDYERRERFLSSSERAELRNARREYNRLLVARKKLVAASQQRLF